MDPEIEKLFQEKQKQLDYICGKYQELSEEIEKLKEKNLYLYRKLNMMINQFKKNKKDKNGNPFESFDKLFN